MRKKFELEQHEVLYYSEKEGKVDKTVVEIKKQRSEKSREEAIRRAIFPKEYIRSKSTGMVERFFEMDDLKFMELAKVVEGE